MGTGVRRYRDLHAWQLAEAFKTEVHRLIGANQTRLISWPYRDQILDAASATPKDIAEGFVRFSPGEFARFLNYALASLTEAEDWLKDGVLRKYFTPSEAETGLRLAKRGWNATLRLKHSQIAEMERRKRARSRDEYKKKGPPPGRPL